MLKFIVLPIKFDYEGQTEYDLATDQDFCNPL